MKKKIMIIAFLSFMLTGCENEKLEVKETKKGYTIKELGTFPWGTDGYTYYSEDNIFFLTGFDRNDKSYRYEMNLETEEFRERITETQGIQESEDPCINTKYGCIYVDNEYIMNENEEAIGENVTYYIQKNDHEMVLYHENYYYDKNIMRSCIEYSELNEKLYLLAGKENEVIYYEYVDGEWKELRHLPYQQEEYQLEYCFIEDVGLRARYSSDKHSRLILNEEEYEFEIDDAYYVSDDYILKETFNERYLPETTYLIDRMTQKTYDLNRVIDLSKSRPMSTDKMILIYPKMADYVSTYHIAVINDLKMTIYVTPFEGQFEAFGIDEKRALFLFADDENQMMTIYLLTLEE